MTRKLASLRTVKHVQAIPKADRIELATIDGWQCIVKKGQFAAGDRGVYFEIDSFLPAGDLRFAFLGDRFTTDDQGRPGARIKTVVMKNSISQGLLLPLTDFPEIATDTPIGTDVSELLGITKWDPPIPAELLGKASGYLPGWVKRTSEERIQNCLELLDDEGEYEVSVKLNGESMTIYHWEGATHVCSHDLCFIRDESNPFWRAALDQNIPDVLPLLGEFAIQGELIGEGVVKNPEGIQGRRFLIFNVWDIKGQRYLAPLERDEFLAKMTAAGATPQQVPILTRTCVPARDFGGWLPTLLAFSGGEASFNSRKRREGIVCKRMDGMASFKVIDNQYLLAEKD